MMALFGHWKWRFEPWYGIGFQSLTQAQIAVVDVASVIWTLVKGPQKHKSWMSAYEQPLADQLREPHPQKVISSGFFQWTLYNFLQLSKPEVNIDYMCPFVNMGYAPLL